MKKIKFVGLLIVLLVVMWCGGCSKSVVSFPPWYQAEIEKFKTLEVESCP